MRSVCTQLKCALAVFKVATDQRFDIFIMLIILLNMFTMAIEYYEAPEDLEKVLHVVNVVFVAIFTAECLIKLVGLRYYYFKNPWNVFDFAVVVMSIVGQCQSYWVFTRYDRRTDRSVRRSYRVNASSDRSDRRSEESNMFDFVRLPIRLSKRMDTTSDWSDRPASRTTNHAAA